MILRSHSTMNLRYHTRYGLVAAILISIILLSFSWYTVQRLNRKISYLSRYLYKRDWHNYKQMRNDELRSGPGEQGVGYQPEINEDRLAYQDQLEGQHGFNAIVSDYISVNRAVADLRHKNCHVKRYLAHLPDISVIMIFNDEHYSVLLRSIHSIVNRTPRELLREIVLVDDASVLSDLGPKLDEYLEKNFPPQLIKLIRLKERSGLIVARSVGAREAKAKVLVFLDSHVEAGANWLPPLLEPIAYNRRTVTCPLIDIIDFEDFTYRIQDEGGRGAFDWTFEYKRLPLRPQDYMDLSSPHEIPIMAGGLFAIARDYFWNLGGYDPGLDIWGGEQYELSFKIWMCGGNMLEVPCSRVGHIYRGNSRKFINPRKYDYLSKNLKRVAEVWMDEYRHYIYNNSEKVIYANIDAGDLTVSRNLRQKLKCKSFDWFMKNVAPDLLLAYPTTWPPAYAEGAVQSMTNDNLCLFAKYTKYGESIGLANCTYQEDGQPISEQNFELSHFKDLRQYHKQYCLEPESNNINIPLQLVDCHQIDRVGWAYDRQKHWLRLGKSGFVCLEAIPSNMSVTVNFCSDDNLHMLWNFSVLNITALDSIHFKPLAQSSDKYK